MGFSRQEYWSELPFPSPGDLPDPGMELGSPYCRQFLYCLSQQSYSNQRIVTKALMEKGSITEYGQWPNSDWTVRWVLSMETTVRLITEGWDMKRRECCQPSSTFAQGLGAGWVYLRDKEKTVWLWRSEGGREHPKVRLVHQLSLAQ